MELGLLQREAAEQIGVNKTTWYNWEGNRTKLPVGLVPKIITFLAYNHFAQPSTLSEKLKVSRQILGLTQRAMAKRLGVDPTTLAKWERGISKPTKRSLTIIQTWLSLQP